MAEGDSHGAVSQLPALRRRQLVHLRTVFLHDQRAGRLSFQDFPHHFHSLLIPPKRPCVNLDHRPPPSCQLAFFFENEHGGAMLGQIFVDHEELATLGFVNARDSAQAATVA
jgi:hypothetical protein